MPERTISVVGLGYIGLPTAAVIASRGVHVVGVDVNQHVVDTINCGRVHIVEPDLDIAVHSSVKTGRLRAYTSPRLADAFLIAVPTPFDANHRPDLSYIEAAARSVAQVLNPGNTIILESTSPVGATERMCEWVAEERPDLSFPHQKGDRSDIRVAHCPERVLPGQVLRELVDNDRVVGGMTERCCEAAKAVYRLFVRGQLICTDVRTAEMCKLTENAFRDVNIAFANELSLLCDHYGIDPWELIELANRHPRVKILQPSSGVGGHCIAVDPWFIISDAPQVAKLMKAARDVNDHKPEYIVAQIERRLAERSSSTVACMGLTFKPDVDDLRESPAMRIVERLLENRSIRVLVVEPHISQLPERLCEFPNARLATMDQALEEADIIVGLVRHQRFIQSLGNRPVDQGRVLDFVNLFG
jgi:UDP-N-acetyl-D-mannosaminuronic acid dehydrogenase